MTKKEYIEKIEQLIINRVKCHAPQYQIQEGDYALLNALNIDVRYPIFLFKKPLNKLLYNAFCMAKRKSEFNLILFEKPKINIKKLNNLKNTYFFPKEDIGEGLFNTLNKLNINYLNKKDFNIQRREEYLKINNKNIKLDFIPFFNNKKTNESGIICEVKQFLLNGKNYCIDFINIRDINNEVELEINIPLVQG